MTKNKIATILAFLAIVQIKAQSQNFEDIVGQIFTSTTPASRRGGFGVIVQPEPEGPTSEPQIFTQNNMQCRCVPYHMCDPRNNTVIGGQVPPANTGNNNSNDPDDEIDGFGIIDIRFDPMSCQDVLDVCCGMEKITGTSINVPPQTVLNPSRPTGCGIRNVGGIDFEITGNTNNEAGFGEFPWTLAIIQTANDSCLCGATLIHPQVVLTANHCVRKFNKNPGALKVRAGEWDTQTTKERLPYQERAVQRVISHPQYEIRTLANDVALLVLQTPFTLDDHIGVVCLPPSSYVPNSRNCYASGWGKDLFGKAGKYSVIMKRVPLPIVQYDKCQNELRKTRLGQDFFLDTTFICAGGEVGLDTCTGDGGAPLVCPFGKPSENRYAINGIVSWGIGCHEARPAVYSNVALARQWIDSQMFSLGYDPSIYTAQ